MKNFLYIFVLFLSFSCKKDDDIPTSIPDGYYDFKLVYEDGNDLDSGIVNLTKKSENELIIYDGNYTSTLSVLNKKVSGYLNLSNPYGSYELDGSWIYDIKTKVYIINGTFTNVGYGMGGFLTIYQYGTFKLTKRK